MMNRTRSTGRSWCEQRLSLLLPLQSGVSIALTAVILSSSSCPVFGQLPSTSSRLSGKVSYNKVSGPESGVELLEKIFNRVMSLPQIAMTKNKPAEEREQRSADPSGVDYTLAIRPKETGKLFSQQPPSLRVLPPPKQAPAAAKAEQAQQDIASAVPSQRQESTFGASAEESADSFNIESWRGGNLQRVGANRSRENILARGDSGGFGIWDKDMPTYGASNGTSVQAPSVDLNAPSIYQGEKPSSGISADKAKSVHLNESQLDNKPGLPAPQAGAHTRNESTAFKQKRDSAPEQKLAAATVSSTASSKKHAEFYNAPRRIQVIDERPLISDFREASPAPNTIQLPPPPFSSQARGAAGGYASNTMLAQGATNKQGYRRAAQAGQSQLPGNAIPAQILSIDDASSMKKSQSGALSSSRANNLSTQLYNKMMVDRAGSDRKELIALLPPNVATGIPLVSLGTSQMQVASALSTMGQLKEQKINRWTVMTWKKPEAAGGKTALQLFFRNGLLDAIRIFEASLVAPDFGVAPGDSLERVKEKFGEPAFLLQEPAQGPGQNYIYPISQVGFQLARGEANSPPKVVSVLIFSVK